MFLAGWFLAGIFIGWLVSSSYRGWQHDSLRDALNQPGTPGQPASASANALVAILAVLAAYGVDQNKLLEISRDGAPRLPAKRPSSWLIFAIALLLALVAFASATDHAALSNGLLAIKSIFAGLRVQALIVGTLVGFFAERQKKMIGDAARQVGGAIIGDKDNTAWALQGAVALAFIAAVVFAIRPDFLDYLRSFKVGTFEATFADRQPTTLREAHLNLRDFREQVALVQYKDFREKFLDPTVPRGWARKLMMDKDVQSETGEIAADLFLDMAPIIDSLLCLQKANALRTATRDYDLVAYAAIWEDFLLELHDTTMDVAKDHTSPMHVTKDPMETTKNKVQKFLGGLKERSKDVAVRADKLTGGCVTERDAKRSKRGGAHQTGDRTEDISNHYLNAVRILRKKGYSEPEVLALTALEPYLTGAVADLIAFISGEREKTDFLIKMLNGFPLSDDFVSPGMVNLFYQATDSWLNSVGPLPLDKVRGMIEYATRGADLTMARSAAKIADIKLRSSIQKAPTTSIDPLDDPANVTKIFDTFLRNSFATLTAETDLYVQRVLGGEVVPEGHRQSWVRAVSRLSAMLQVRLRAPSIDLDGVPRTEIDEFTKERLRVEKNDVNDLDDDGNPRVTQEDLVDADFMLRADLAVALSSILLNANRSPSAQACNTALFYVNDSARWVPPTKAANELDRAQEQRLEQLISAVAAYIDDACTMNATKG